jgi:putative cell wall-binding protein
MIKFFRKIRQNLLSEGKTGKYFKYAIGEIVLVVIGILIALQINNWNENRKNKIAEADYYCRILNDFEFNEKLIDETSKLTTNRIKLCKKLLIDLNSIPNDRSKILNDFVVAVRQDVFVPSTITFDDLTSSGQLKLLTDIKLKNRLIEHSTYLNNTLDLLEENRNELIKRMMDYESTSEFGYQDIDYLNQELDKEIIALLPKTNWTNDPTHPIFLKFQDNLVFMVAMFIRQKQHLSNLKKEMEEPIKLLKNKKCK